MELKWIPKNCTVENPKFVSFSTISQAEQFTRCESCQIECEIIIRQHLSDIQILQYVNILVTSLSLTVRCGVGTGLPLLWQQDSQRYFPVACYQLVDLYTQDTVPTASVP